MEDEDPHDLQRFLRKQDVNYVTALEELQRGRKRSHWIWYVFPQVSGLGFSSMSRDFAIRSREEAVAYLSHPVLGTRLRECCDALLEHRGQRIKAVLGYPDNLKLQSSMTLFSAISPKASVFHDVLAAFYEGEQDPRTLDFLNA